MEFLNKILSMLLKWIPRIKMIQPDELGTRVTLGKYEKHLEPGWYFYWGIAQKIHYMVVTPCWADLRGQSVFSKDGQNLVVSGAVRYRVTDVRRAMLTINDVDISLAVLALGIILEYVGKRTTAECIDPRGLASEILKGVREQAAGWGVKVMEVRITDWGITQNLRVIMDSPNTAIIPVTGDAVE